MIKQKMKRVLIVQIQFLNLSLVELDLGKVKVNSGLRVVQTQVIFSTNVDAILIVFESIFRNLILESF